MLIDQKKVDLKFLAYQLSTDPIQQFVAMNKRGATIKGITRECLKEIRVSLPPLSEQKKIAHIFRWYSGQSKRRSGSFRPPPN